MEIMNDLELPNKETIYFYNKIYPWIAHIDWTNADHIEMRVTFKHNVPIDILNRFLICRPKLAGKYTSDYIIEDK